MRGSNMHPSAIVFVLYCFVDRALFLNCQCLFADSNHSLKDPLSSVLPNDRMLKHRGFTINGLKNAPKALIGIFNGENIGKLLKKVADS